MIYKIDTKNPDDRYPNEIILITEHDTWEDIAKAFTKFYNYLDIGELIYAIIELKPVVLDEILSWTMVKDKLKEMKK